MTRPKHLVISAVNITEAGMLKILQDSLETAAQCLPSEWKITALVHRKSLINNHRVETLEFPWSKRSWSLRLWHEWFTFKKLSHKLKADLWLSLHDITPRVQARRQAVYCHNTAPFYRLTWREARLEPVFAVFNLMYAHLYRVFISRNHTVIVQQDWLRKTFQRLYACQNVVVAFPTHQTSTRLPSQTTSPSPRRPVASQPLVLFYPSLPRVYKNFEILCEAMKLLSPGSGCLLELRLTISGTENRYARDLYQHFSSVPGIHFIGRQTKEQMEQQYKDCDLVLFPSKLESWGIPITEARAYGKPILVADLPYAYETAGSYKSVSFLPVQDAGKWATAFEKLAAGNWRFNPQTQKLPDAPFAKDWTQLWSLLIKDL